VTFERADELYQLWVESKVRTEISQDTRFKRNSTPGEMEALANDLFSEGKTNAEVVAALRVTFDQVDELRLSGRRHRGTTRDLTSR